MTDKHLPDDPSTQHFLSRRERREYERTQEQARRASDVQRAANGETAATSEHQETRSDSGPGFTEIDTPQPLAADGPGGIADGPQGPLHDPLNNVSDSGHKAADQDVDCGDLQPIPEDTRES